MRRRQQVEQLVFNDLIINFLEQRVIGKTPGGQREIDLTPREYRLLCYLARNCGVALSREDILKAVWGESMHVSNRSIDTHVAALRRKMGPMARHIKSVHGTGYRFIADTSPLSRQTA
jgi:DNA-binding response OmpR family regulator